MVASFPRSILSRRADVIPSFFVISIVTFLVLLQTPFLTTRGSRKGPPLGPAIGSYSRGVIHSVLHNSHLSHLAFHKGLVKDQLLRIVSPTVTTPVVVVGVSHGQEVISFARAGHQVYAFDPVPPFVESVRERLELMDPPPRAEVFQMAAGEENGTIEIKYQGREVRGVQKGRVQDYVKIRSERVALMSVDVQGGELDVLRGAGDLVGKNGAKMLWVEVGACKSVVTDILKTLDEDYVLFDFVPWGRSTQNDEFFQSGRESFLLNDKRPGEFAAWDRWFCEERTKGYVWMQTDLVAIDRQLLASENGRTIELGLQRLAEEACVDGECRLRHLMKEGSRR